MPVLVTVPKISISRKSAPRTNVGSTSSLDFIVWTSIDYGITRVGGPVMFFDDDPDLSQVTELCIVGHGSPGQIEGRDAAAIAEIAAAAARRGEDPGGAAALSRYHEARRLDVGSRTLAVDLLNRSLLTDLLPVQGARGLGLYLLDRIGPLRRAVMREGVSPRAAEPRLMRGEAP